MDVVVCKPRIEFVNIRIIQNEAMRRGEKIPFKKKLGEHKLQIIKCKIKGNALAHCIHSEKNIGVRRQKWTAHQGNSFWCVDFFFYKIAGVRRWRIYFCFGLVIFCLFVSSIQYCVLNRFKVRECVCVSLCFERRRGTKQQLMDLTKSGNIDPERREEAKGQSHHDSQTNRSSSV